MKKSRKVEITKTIIKGIFITGGIVIASTSPYFAPKILSRILRYTAYKLKTKKQKKQFYNTFSYLKNRGFIKVKNIKGQIYISLTEEGKKKAGKYQIDDLNIKKQKRWDKKWRILIFDIKDKQKIKREALRGKIKELGFFQLQKSVWIYPYDFQKEIELLRSFFGLTKDEMQVIIASKVENDIKARKFFRIT